MNRSAVQQNTADLHQLKLFGWCVAGVLLSCWAGWLSLLALSNGTAITAVEEREAELLGLLFAGLQHVELVPGEQ